MEILSSASNRNKVKDIKNESAILSFLTNDMTWRHWWFYHHLRHCELNEHVLHFRENVFIQTLNKREGVFTWMGFMVILHSLQFGWKADQSVYTSEWRLILPFSGGSSPEVPNLHIPSRSRTHAAIRLNDLCWQNVDALKGKDCKYDKRKVIFLGYTVSYAKFFSPYAKCGVLQAEGSPTHQTYSTF